MNRYVNAREVLPESLIREIQKYVKGQQLYIPQTTRENWGTSTGIREELRKRNNKITEFFHGGMSLDELAELYNLSQERIRCIIYDNQDD